MFIKMRRDFLTGVLVILPILLTIILIKSLIGAVNNILLQPIVGLFERHLPSGSAVLFAKALVFFAVVYLIILIGLATRSIILRRLFGLIENLILFKMPLVRKVYSTIKEISNAFLGQQYKGSFLRVVLVEFPRAGIKSVGFVTHDDPARDSLHVFVPTTPNPTSGFLLLLPRKDVFESNMTVEEALKLVISAGTLSSEKV